MVKLGMRGPRLFFVFLSIAIAGCAGKTLKLEKADEERIQRVEEFEKKVKIKVIEPAPEEKAEEPGAEASKKKVVKETKTKPISKPKKEDSTKKVSKPKKKKPSMEDNEGFDGRRPIVDPFKVGEKVVLDVTYFNMAAGDLTFETKPFVEVNGRKNYHFSIKVQSRGMFNYFYSVDDWAETYMDYETMTPSSHLVTVKESKQRKESRSFFNTETNTATFWEKSIKPGKKETKKKKEWKIKPFSQNVISAIFYLRAFTLRVGKELAFRVADDGKNIVFKGKVLREEKLKTEIGELDTFVVKPELKVDGVFKPVGDIFIWLTNDDRKHIVRIEAKIKIGTLILKLKEIN